MSEEKPCYYAILPAEVRYDPNLRDKAKLLYAEITALSNKDGYCYATNKYFADLYETTTTTISTLIKELIENEYLESEIIYKENTKEIDKRYLKIFKEGYLKKFKGGIKENLKGNNINNNITSINNNIYNKIQKMTSKIFSNNEYLLIEELLKTYTEEEILDVYRKYGNKPVKYIEQVLKNMPKKTTPSWFNQEIESTECETDEEFKNFIEEFRK